MNNTFEVLKTKYKDVLFYVITAFVYDILIRFELVPDWSIYVSESYIDIIFTVLCTVATLGNAIQSIIIGSFNEKIFGFSVREIASNSEYIFDIPQIVVISFSSILLGVFTKIFQFYNLLTMMTICIVVIISNSNKRVWKLLSDEGYQKEILNDIIRSNIIPPSTLYLRWFQELAQSLESRDETTQNIYIELIKNEYRLDEKISCAGIFENELKRIFPFACISIGFADAYKKIICLGEAKAINVDRFAIVRTYADEIRFCPEQSIEKYHIAETVRDIIYVLEVPEDDAVSYIQILFYSVKENYVIGEMVRDRLIKDIFEVLCWLYDEKSGEVKKDSILHIVKYYILENDNLLERNKIFGLLIWEIYYCNRPSSDQYIAFLSELFRAIYFYSFLENEVLKSDYRNGIKNLIDFQENKKFVSPISLINMISEKRNEISVWLCDDISSWTYLKDYIFECKNPDAEVRSVVFVFQNCFFFAFSFCVLIKCPSFPFSRIIESNEEDVRLKINICQKAISCFSVNGEEFGPEFYSFLETMKGFIKIEWESRKDCISSLFSYYNKMLSEIQQTEYEPFSVSSEFDVVDVNNNLMKAFEEFNIFSYSDSVALEGMPTFRVSTVLQHASKNEIPNITREIFDIVEGKLNLYVNSVFKRVVLSFDQNGVNTLFAELCGEEYKYGNYKFVNDLALLYNDDISESQEYETLCTLIAGISMLNDSELSCRVFLKSNHIMFNAKVISCEKVKPSNIDAEDYISHFKIADGKYRIDGAVMDHDSAVEYAKKCFVSHHYEICVATNIKPDDGFVVDFSDV